MLKARDYNPAVKFGAKWLPNDLAGMIGLPYVGNIFYVDCVSGLDTNSGTDQNNAFKTLTAAYAATTNNHHDVIILAPSGPGTGAQPYATTETAAITWSKNLTHLIGNVAPVLTSPRARVSTATAALSPFITISGQGCIFKNVMFLSDAATNFIVVRVSGNRNAFLGCHFANINATAMDTAGFAHLELYGGQENYFGGCTIGVDTITATAAGSNLAITLGSDTVARNTFDACIFPMIADADAPRFIIQGDSVGMDRWNLFRGCQFVNATSSTSTTQTDAINIHATPGGMLLLHDCLMVGATGWANNLTNVNLLGFSTNSTILTNYCKAVNPAA